MTDKKASIYLNKKLPQMSKKKCFVVKSWHTESNFEVPKDSNT